MKYFTSDLHYFDKNLIECGIRTFPSVEEMHNKIISNFKSKIDGNGEVYVLGDIVGMDFDYMMKKDLPQIFDQMGINNPNTPFHLVLGNHDLFPIQDYMDMGFVSVEEIDGVNIGKLKVMLTHDPCMVQIENTLALCGHVHTLFEHVGNVQRNTLAINISVEVRNYTPVSEDEIVTIIENSAWVNTQS